jgi:hypothetical protein
VNLNVVFCILRFDRKKQRPEPLERSEISANPEKVHLPQPRAALWVVHPVPDALQDGGKRRHTNTGAHQYSDLKLEYVLRC